MSSRNVILVVLATVVIFALGVVTGAMIVRQTAPRPTPPAMFMSRFDGIRRTLDDPRLQVTPGQRNHIDGILRDKQDLIADYFNILAPDLQQTFRQTMEEVRAQLTPEQRRRFEEIGRQRTRRPSFPRDDLRRPGSEAEPGYGPPSDRPAPDRLNRGRIPPPGGEPMSRPVQKPN